jgi:hypothetical protein
VVLKMEPGEAKCKEDLNLAKGSNVIRPVHGEVVPDDKHYGHCLRPCVYSGCVDERRRLRFGLGVQKVYNGYIVFMKSRADSH